MRGSTHDTWWFVLAAAGVFLVGFLVGLQLPAPAPVEGEEVQSGGGIFAVDDPTAVTFAVNNLTVTLVLLAGGVTFGLTTIVGLLFNGYLLGVLVSAALERGVAASTVALYVLPHGVFELSGFFLAAAVGLAVPVRFVQYLRGEQDRPISPGQLVGFVRLSLTAAVLVVLGAWIEAHLTGPIAATAGA